MPYIFCISKRVCGLPIYGGTTPKQPPFTRQTLNDVSNKYEFVFFISWTLVNFHIKLAALISFWKLGVVYGLGPCFVYVPELSQTFGQCRCFRLLFPHVRLINLQNFCLRKHRSNYLYGAELYIDRQFESICQSQLCIYSARLTHISKSVTYWDNNLKKLMTNLKWESLLTYLALQRPQWHPKATETKHKCSFVHEACVAFFPTWLIHDSFMTNGYT